MGLTPWRVFLYCSICLKILQWHFNSVGKTLLFFLCFSTITLIININFFRVCCCPGQKILKSGEYRKQMWWAPSEKLSGNIRQVQSWDEVYHLIVLHVCVLHTCKAVHIRVHIRFHYQKTSTWTGIALFILSQNCS